MQNNKTIHNMIEGLTCPDDQYAKNGNCLSYHYSPSGLYRLADSYEV